MARPPAAREAEVQLFELLTVHSLTWLVVANAVGLLLATLLLVPRAGVLLGPLTYGRWMPLHLDLELYGWCGLPLAGLLLKLYLPASGPGRPMPLAVRLWSGGLAFGAVSWLAGGSSGKLFLEWSGAARAVLAACLAFLGLSLLIGYWRQVAARQLGRAALAVRGALLPALLAVPWILYLAASPAVYPPINPASGGATGSSLLGSTLGVVAIFLGCPLVLGLRPRDGGRAARQGLAVLLAHGAVFALLGHGDRSNHELAQVLGLASVAVWLPLLARHLRRFEWPAASRPWLAALGAWGLLLVLSGVVAFLPGVLERWKFTHVLVAHAHVAMAGMATSLNVLVLNALNRSSPLARIFAGRAAFALWQGGGAVLVAALLALGLIEAASPGVTFRGGAAVTALDAVRWAGGAMMLAASVRWLAAATGQESREPVPGKLEPCAS